MSLLLAVLIDRWWGEPPARFHPVVWMGGYLRWAGRLLPSYGPRRAMVLGSVYWLLGAAVVAGVFWYASLGIAQLPLWLGIPLTALLLKPLFAMRMLLDEVAAVEQALLQSVAAGRERLAMIVSRDTAQLDATQIREASLESLAENLSDSVVAPLFWFVLLGLPGAAVYRFANTADAMWGYRGSWEWAGKFAARADDVLNLVPARLTAIMLLLVSPQGRPQPWRLLRQQAVRTPSPNSGWPMAALALALNVRLSKPGVYVLNEQGTAPESTDVTAALRSVARTAWVVAVTFAVVAVTLQRVGHG